MSNSSKNSDVSTARHASRYLVVGITITIFNFCASTLVARFIINNNDLLWLSNLIGTFITIFVAFFLHSKITWRERNPGKSGIIRFFIWNLILTFIICPGFTWFFSLLTPIYELAFNISNSINLPFDYDFIQSTGAFGFTSIVIMILNFLFYDKFVFGKKPVSTFTTLFNHSSEKVSVIVPIYNTGKYLPACIDSILKQTHTNLEIILVDDGSTDDSAKIIDNYAKQDKRIKAIHQKNSGQSAARNQGLKIATGDYISFIDSDDKIKPSFIIDLLQVFDDRTSLAICGIHYKRLKSQTAEDVYINPLRSRRSHESKKAYILHLLALDGRLYSSVNKLYHADFAKKCSFDEKLNFAEDTKFVLDYLKKTPGEIRFVLKANYIYNFGTDTSTIKSTATTWANWQTSYKNLKNWLGAKPTAQEKFWLHLVHLRWRISYIRSKRRAK